MHVEIRKAIGEHWAPILEAEANKYRMRGGADVHSCGFDRAATLIRGKP